MRYLIDNRAVNDKGGCTVYDSENKKHIAYCPDAEFGKLIAAALNKKSRRRKTNWTPAQQARSDWEQRQRGD